MPGRILIVDDEPSMCELLEADLGTRGFEPVWFTSADEAFAELGGETFDVVLTDLNMPGLNGIDLCKRIVANRPDTPVIVITAFGSLETAVAAIRAGAYDFVTKPVEMDVLALTLERALKHRALRQKVRVLSAAVERSQRFHDLLGRSPAMQRVFDQLTRVAESDISVLITGESGTGKELVARALHKQSARRTRPFVAINCAALPETLLESELFGHVRGAFTGASVARKGLFAQAGGGTLFLDEVGEIPVTLQPKLLRALDERTARPIGGDKELPFDVRLVAATNQDLESAVDEGRFRQDLFFRLNVVQIELPPLRARGTDILLLAQHVLEHLAAHSQKPITGLSEPFAEKLLVYSWPGNVRELKNAMERAVALTRHDKLCVEDLPEKIRAYRRSHLVIGGEDPIELASMAEVERRYILHVLEATGDNKTLAARVLGFDRRTLYRKLARYNRR
ncbi:sigma-54-dependent transcriptional regulator [Planctomycetota bacterium]